MSTLTFKPKAVSKKLILELPDRSRDIVIKRYGLSEDSAQTMTLEKIGELYGITRERVRQIENHSLSIVRKSESFNKHKDALTELKETIARLGGVVAEDHLLEHISRDESTQNHAVFLLVLGKDFKRKKEDGELTHRWYLDDELHDVIHLALSNLYAGMAENEIVSESEIVDQFLDHLKDVSHELRNEEIARRWLLMSKRIGRNPLGEWGRASSSNIRVKGIRDYAYLVIRKNGSPMHFTEVAKRIEDLFEKKAHPATTHNELIKDGRFVLVGRGLYALKEWGYSSGIVRDVIKETISQNGPLTKEEIINKVLKERYVKSNTVLVNLQDSNFFIRDREGRYHLKQSV